jgi:hypothetical protein
MARCLVGMYRLGGRIAIGAGQLAEVPPRNVLWDNLRDYTVLPRLPVLQHVVQVLLALVSQIPCEDLTRHLFLQRFVGR